ncbi:uncharacterized protein B0I36DRAFT_326953 [Microdochium trichocladiopsis]|uniref:Uncharacterized protein n=1 Tax=Microdochium trichocladiopsis TaxID=1682393 RepID=A0A9P8Y4C0_9PEZI|nr:uncharacterized protein B0I36DRAFT_326953 [Microdochium trichocladiopsis]KAH7027365.1 hypothetical protein B0I36DRAFT_326953 [Microdochium trichocladiopsis]
MASGLTGELRPAACCCSCPFSQEYGPKWNGGRLPQQALYRALHRARAMSLPLCFHCS